MLKSSRRRWSNVRIRHSITSQHFSSLFPSPPTWILLFDFIIYKEKLLISELILIMRCKAPRYMLPVGWCTSSSFPPTIVYYFHNNNQSNPPPLLLPPISAEKKCISIHFFSFYQSEFKNFPPPFFDENQMDMKPQGGKKKKGEKKEGNQREPIGPYSSGTRIHIGK